MPGSNYQELDNRIQEAKDAYIREKSVINELRNEVNTRKDSQSSPTLILVPEHRRSPAFPRTHWFRMRNTFNITGYKSKSSSLSLREWSPKEWGRKGTWQPWNITGIAEAGECWLLTSFGYRTQAEWCNVSAMFILARNKEHGSCQKFQTRALYFRFFKGAKLYVSLAMLQLQGTRWIMKIQWLAFNTPDIRNSFYWQ